MMNSTPTHRPCWGSAQKRTSLRMGAMGDSWSLLRYACKSGQGLLGREARNKHGRRSRVHVILTPEPKCQPEVAGPAGALQVFVKGRGTRKCERPEQPAVSTAPSPSFLDLGHLLLDRSLTSRAWERVSSRRGACANQDHCCFHLPPSMVGRPGWQEQGHSLRGLQQLVWDTSKILASWQGTGGPG